VDRPSELEKGKVPRHGNRKHVPLSSYGFEQCPVGGVGLKCIDMQKADAFVVEGSLRITKYWEKS
jgi:hypothetical protein